MAHEVQELHFRVGETAGLLLTQIAREHLLYNYNPNKALAAIEDSFGGEVPRELTLAIIKGDMIILVDVEDQMFNVTSFIEGIHEKLGYEKLDIVEWIERQQREIRQNSQHLQKVLNEQRVKAKYSKIRVDFTYDQILKFITGDDEVMLDNLRDEFEINALAGLVQSCKMYFEKAMKIEAVIGVLNKWYPEECANVKESTSLYYLNQANNELNKLLTLDLVDVAKTEDNVREFVEAAQEIDRVLSEGIKPVDIMENWSAGWLAPNGDYYALNGEIANMLHNQIADALVEAGIVPEEELNPDAWLEQQGWVKIHDSNVQFAGCLNVRIGKKNVDLTPIQIKKIYEYGALCHGGAIKAGWRMEQVSAIRFKDMAQTDLEGLYKKYFEY